MRSMVMKKRTNPLWSGLLAGTSMMTLSQSISGNSQSAGLIIISSIGLIIGVIYLLKIISEEE